MQLDQWLSCVGVAARNKAFWCRGNDPQQGVEKGQSEAFEDVQLGPLLGQGGFGKVYRGLWNGAAVAVKVQLHLPALDCTACSLSAGLRQHCMQLMHVKLY